MNTLILKWGTVKGWSLEDETAKSALQRWANYGVSASAVAQKDTPEQKQALLEAIDHMDEIYFDWEDKLISKEEAKSYILNYGKEK